MGPKISGAEVACELPLGTPTFVEGVVEFAFCAGAARHGPGVAALSLCNDTWMQGFQ